jgi:hypothetical protein
LLRSCAETIACAAALIAVDATVLAAAVVPTLLEKK